MREFPAYGRTIAMHIRRGKKPICVVVLLSSRWGYFDHLPKVCIKPDEWRARAYEFSYLSGMHVVVVLGDEATERQLGELLIDLMRVGPRLLWVWNADWTKLYDGSADADWPMTLAEWVHKLTAGQIHYREAKAAAEVMAAAQQDAATRWHAEWERIWARSPEDAVRFHVESEGLKDRVRELLSTPYRESSERAA